MTGELVRIGSVEVAASAAARRVARDGRPRDIAAALAADLLLQGRLVLDRERLTVDVVLVAGDSERKTWYEAFSGSVTEIDELEQRIAAAAATAVTAHDAGRD